GGRPVPPAAGGGVRLAAGLPARRRDRRPGPAGPGGGAARPAPGARDGGTHRRPGAERRPGTDRRPSRRRLPPGRRRAAALGVRPLAFEVVPSARPFRDPFVTARGSLARREMALLRLRDADGVEGLGEAVPLSLRG